MTAFGRFEPVAWGRSRQGARIVSVKQRFFATRVGGNGASTYLSTHHRLYTRHTTIFKGFGYPSFNPGAGTIQIKGLRESVALFCGQKSLRGRFGVGICHTMPPWLDTSTSTQIPFVAKYPRHKSSQADFLSAQKFPDTFFLVILKAIHDEGLFRLDAVKWGLAQPHRAEYCEWAGQQT